MEIVNIFLVLLFINWVCDYPLQDSFLKENKLKNKYVLFIHSFIWGMGIYLGLMYYNIQGEYYWKLIMLVAGHFFVDSWKCHEFSDYVNQKISYKQLKTIYYMDQLFHIGQILICIIIK